MNTKAYTRYSGIDLKQCFFVTETVPVTNLYSGETWFECRRQEVLVGVNRGKLRLRYPDGSTSRVQYLPDAPEDLVKLSVMCIAELIPTSIYADALEDAAPQHREACDILRRWWAVKQEQP